MSAFSNWVSRPQWAPFGGADQIEDRRIGGTHLGQRLLGRDAAIHHPDALGLAVLGFDLAQHGAQRGFVGRISGQHLVGERKSFRGYDQGDHHLHAIAALVAAITIAALVFIIVRRGRFEIGAGQVIEQHLEGCPKQIGPALAQMREQRLFVRQQPVQAAVERILLGQAFVGAEQVRHRTLFEPLPVQAPFAAGVDQPIAHQRLQDMLPRGAFARVGQAIGPEAVEFELRVELTRQPARPPLPRPVQRHGIEPHLHAMPFGVVGKLPIRRKQRELAMAAGVRIEGFDQTAPSFVLAIVDLAEIQHLALHYLTGDAPPILDDAPVSVLFAVFVASVEAQEHDSTNTPRQNRGKDTWSPLQTIFDNPPLF
jgi:hypothetical protein